MVRHIAPAVSVARLVLTVCKYKQTIALHIILCSSVSFGTKVYKSFLLRLSILIVLEVLCRLRASGLSENVGDDGGESMGIWSVCIDPDGLK